jgi:citrate synthase
MVFDIGDAVRAEAYNRGKLERKERLMGFGHRENHLIRPQSEYLGSRDRKWEKTEDRVRVKS